MSLNLKVAVVGAGYWGKNLIRALYELRTLKAVCEKDEQRLSQLRDTYPDLRLTPFLSDILEDSEIQGVVIVAPPGEHYPLAKQVLQAGKDVFVEKPLTLDLREGEELVRLAQDKGKILMVGHLLHYHPALMQIKKMLSGGEIGDLWYVYSHRLNLGKVRSQENVLFSLVPHDISLFLSFFGSLPESVFAQGGDFLQKGIEDKVVVALDFGQNKKAHIFASWLNPFKERRLTLVGSKGMLVFDDLNREEALVLYRYEKESLPGDDPIVSPQGRQIIPLENSEPLKNECQHFIDCLLSRRKPITDGAEGLRVLKVLFAAQESLKKGEKLNLKEYPSDKSYFVHPTSWVDENVQIGEGTKIWHFSHILSNSQIGKNCVIGQNVMIGPEVTVGNGCKIQNNVSIYRGVILEDEVFCGPSMVFTNVINPRAFIERKTEFRKTLVKRGATIGANATVVCGVTLGRYSLVGAGAVVTRNVPDYALVIGVPARQIGWVCKCGVRLEEGEKLVCPECCNVYCRERNSIKPEKEG